MAGLVRCVSRITLLNGYVSSQLLNKKLTFSIQAANISSKALRELNNVKRPLPYDYKNDRYTVFHSWFDRTSKRFDENTKVRFF